MFWTRHLVLTLMALLLVTTAACGDDQEPVDNLFLKVTADADVSDLSQLRLLFKQGTTRFPDDINAAEFNPLLNSLDPRAQPVYLSIRYNATTFADPNVRLYVSGLGANGVAAVFHGPVNLSQAQIIDVRLQAVGTDCDGDSDGFVDCSVPGCCASDDEPVFSDCDPAGSAVNPWAVEPTCEPCGDTVDQDCTGGVVACVDDDTDGVADCLEVEAGCGVGASTVGPGLPELCDGLDNDCDGAADEDFTLTVDGEALSIGDACGLGLCAGGIVVCAGGVAACDKQPLSAEVCGDGMDNDCDGDVDEGCAGDLDGDGFNSLDDCNDFDSGIYPGRPNEACCPVGADVAACDTDCDGSTTPCDAADNDGDGFTVADGDCDDSDPLAYPSAPERCGDGIDQDCFGGDALCADVVDNDGDGWSAPADCNDNDPSISPQGSELEDGKECDGVDNDCDGDIDDGNPSGGGQCGTDVGVCEFGIQVCSQTGGAGLVCVGAVEPALTEVCDGKDNDCNGFIDDGIEYEGIAIGQACTGIGACGDTVGVVECVSTDLQLATCSTNPNGSNSQATTELCNDIDDDCDGDIDNGVEQDLVEAACTLAGPCAGTVTATCGAGGEWLCDYTAVPNWEADEMLCDGIDNDCDGTVDEGYGLGVGCDGDDPDSCESGFIECISPTASGCVEPPDSVAVEVCDGVDNDCDTMVDEGFSAAETADPDGDNSPNCIDEDDDGDGVVDTADNCGLIPNADQLNTDGDTAGNVCDGDDDDDTIGDEDDNCPLDVNADQLNTDGSDDGGDACDPDDDNDGVNDNVDNCQLDINADQLNTDGDALGNVCDDDDDGDLVDDNADNCPLDVNADQLNTDGDALGNVCDDDDDGDGVDDADDNCVLLSNSNQANLDGDALGDVCDDDLDGDGTDNAVDNCPDLANADQLDADGDDVGDLCDPDRDGDGVGNTTDNCPDVSNSAQDNLDGDPLGDACDDDDDGDGVLEEACPGDPSALCDDNCPVDPNPNQLDTDVDGQGNVCDDDDDGDGVLDNADNCPLLSNPDQTNTDGANDGGDVCDADDDNDTVNDVADNCPLDPNVGQTNTDGDALGDACDADLDGDGINELPDDPSHPACAAPNLVDCFDNCPFVANPAQADLDGDGQGDACDDDIDGDGILTTAPSNCSNSTALCSDNCPLTPNADQADQDNDQIGDVCDNCVAVANFDQADGDGNGVGDACEPGATDTDGDGVFDDTDNCIDDPNPLQEDLDTDTIGDACDPDADGDFINEAGNPGPCTGGATTNCNDNCPGLDNELQEDEDGDGIGDACDTGDDDADDDTVPDATDNCVEVPNVGQEDWDGDGIGDVCDPCAMGTEPYEVRSDCIDNNCDTVFDDGATERAVVSIKAVDAVDAGYSVSVIVNHAQYVADGAAADGSDLHIYHRSAAGVFTQLHRVLDPTSSWNAADTKIWFALVDGVAAMAQVDDAYFVYVNTPSGTVLDDENEVFHFADFFERSDSNAIGNGWTEDEPNAVSVRLENGAIQVFNTGNAAYSPRLQRSIDPVSTGVWRWRYGFDWDMVGNPSGPDDVDYAVYMQLGDATKFDDTPEDATDRLGSFYTAMWFVQLGPGGGFAGHNWLYFLTSANFVESYGGLAGFHDMTVDSDLEDQTNLLSIDGIAQASKGVTDPTVTELNAIRLLGHRLNMGQIEGGRFDYVLVRPLVATEPTVSDGTPDLNLCD